MDFLLWAARSLHLFAVVVWVGGLLYQAAVALPVARAEKKELDSVTIHLLLRFQPFVWMCVWTIVVTGIALMLFDPRFVLFRYESSWSVLLGLKQLTFAVMAFFSLGYVRMLRRVAETKKSQDTGETTNPFYRQMLLFGRINVGLAIVALLLAAGMNS